MLQRCMFICISLSTCSRKVGGGSNGLDGTEVEKRHRFSASKLTLLLFNGVHKAIFFFTAHLPSTYIHICTTVLGFCLQACTVLCNCKRRPQRFSSNKDFYSGKPNEFYSQNTLTFEKWVENTKLLCTPCECS